MENKHNILEQFRQLDPQHILSLSPDQMKSWLLSLHPQSKRQDLIRLEKDSRKSKCIHKVYNKRRFKDYVKRKIGLCSASTSRVSQNPQSPNIFGSSAKSHKDREGKLKFKSTSQPTHQLKINKFSTSIHLALTQTNYDQLTCPICLQLLICPALTSCGHTFCYRCIDESLLFSHNCPNCRQNIRGCQPIVCTVLQKLIKFKVDLQKDNQQEFNHYKQRVVRFQLWKIDRMLNYQNLQNGQMVDIRDTQSIWCQGTIIQIYQKYDKNKHRRGVTSLLVHYSRWHKIYNQIIELPSNRVAPLSYFSARSDIPHYNLAEEEGNVRGSVSLGSMRVEAPQPVHFIRIEESQDQVISDSFFSELQNLQSQIEEQEENLSNLDPEQQNQREEAQNEDEQSESVQQQGVNLREYVNQIRRNVLMRLAPNFVQRAEAISIQDDSQSIQQQEAPQQLDSQSQNNSEQSLVEINEEQRQYFQPPNQLQSISQSDPIAFHPHPQFADLFRDISSEHKQMFGPDEPSDMLDDCL